MNSLRKYWDFREFKDKTIQYVTATISIVFAISPDVILNYKITFLNNYPQLNDVFVRLFIIGTILLFSWIIIIKQMITRKEVIIKGKNYCIKIEYGDIFKINGCKKVISFDECFTTTIGDNPEDIYSNSICGQFLSMHPNLHFKMNKLIQNAGISPLNDSSNFAHKTRYKSGTIVPFEDYLLLAFVPLDISGRGKMTYEQYLDSLSTLWKEIDKYHAGKDVCIPILGSSSATHINDKELTKQELLDVIIASYKLSADKLQSPCTLHIICKSDENFSLNQIGKFI